MLFTPEQIRQIKQIIEDAHSAFIVNYLDVGAVSPATLKRLQSLGMVKTQQTAIKDVYLLGQVLAASKDPKFVAQSHAEVRRQLQRDPVPLLARVAAASSDPALRRMTPDDVRSAMQTGGYALLQRMAQATQGQPGAVAMPTPPTSGQPPNLLPLMTRLVHQSQGPNYPDMSVARLKEQLRTNPIPLSEAEKQAVTMANERAAQYVTGLGNRVSAQTGQMVINADAQLRRQLRDVIRTQTARNVAARETVARLKSDLGHATSDWTRDLDRIAVTEKQTAMQEGQAAAVAKRYGGKAQVAKLTRPTCCPQCAAAYLENGRPRIFNLADLEANGTNVGRKQTDWKATLAPLHPNCLHGSSTVLTEFGYRRIDTLAVGERVYTHKGRLRPISHIWVSRYEGPMLHMRAYPHQTLKVTPNHPIFGSGDTKRAAETVQVGHEVRCGLLSRFASPERTRLRHNQVAVRAMYGTTPEGVPGVAIVMGNEMFVHRGSLDRWLKGMERMQRPALEGIFIRRQKPDGTTTLEGIIRGARDVEGRSVRRVKFTRCRPVGKVLYEEVDEMAPARAASTLLAKRRRPARTRRAPVTQPAFHAVQTVHLLAQHQGTTTPNEHQITLRLGHIDAEEPEPHAEWRSPQEPITDVWQEPHRGAVYNLTVQDDHSYVAEGVVVGNCTCQLVSVPPGFAFNGQGEMVPSTSPSLQRSQKAKTVPAMRLRKAEPAPLPRPRLGATPPERHPQPDVAPLPERVAVRRIGKAEGPTKGHRYIRRERQNDKWVYTYPEDGRGTGKPAPSAKDHPDYFFHQRALASYQREGDFIQEFIRGTRAHEGSPQMRAIYKKKVKHLDTLAKNSPLTKDTVLWRGASDKRMGHLAPGATYQDSGFTSASKDARVAAHFAELHGAADKTCLIEIRAKAGQPAIDVAQHLPSPTSTEEQEVLLSRHTKFRVISSTPADKPGGRRHIVVEAEPQDG